MEEKIIELLNFLKNDMKNHGRDFNTYRYKIRESNLTSLNRIANINELKTVVKECKKRNLLKQIELGCDGSFAFTELGLGYITL